jgi:ribose-phosphate pyrophosphokinase
MMMMMMSSTLTSSSSFNDVSNHNTRRFKKKNQFRLNTPTTKTTTAVRNKVQKNITIKAEAISEDSSSSFSKNSDIFADLVENSFGSTNDGFVERGEHIISSQFNQHQNQSISNTKNALKVFSGSAHPELSTEIANYLGMDLGKLTIKKFADGEIYVQINESIRGSDVFLVQPTCPPTNDNIMELLVMIDACRRASCRSITAVIPYFGYARADRRTAGRESIAAKLVANLLTQAGATRAVLMDIHSLQTIGYYDIPVDHIYGETVILDYLTSKDFHPDEVVVVSPDVGGVPRARAFAKKLADAPLAIIDKRRTGHNKAQVMNLIGDVEGKVCVMLDDMIDTGGTLLAGAELCRTLGAREVYACATHAVFSPPAVERLGSGAFTEVIVTNSIPHTPERDFAQLTVLSVGNLLGETIWRVHNDTPVSFNKL